MAERNVNCWPPAEHTHTHIHTQTQKPHAAYWYRNDSTTNIERA